MPTLTDFQKRLEERDKCPELAELLILFLKGNSMGFSIVKVPLQHQLILSVLI